MFSSLCTVKAAFVFFLYLSTCLSLHPNVFFLLLFFLIQFNYFSFSLVNCGFLMAILFGLGKIRNKEKKKEVKYSCYIWEMSGCDSPGISCGFELFSTHPQ